MSWSSRVADMMSSRRLGAVVRMHCSVIASARSACAAQTVQLDVRTPKRRRVERNASQVRKHQLYLPVRAVGRHQHVAFVELIDDDKAHV